MLSENGVYRCLCRDHEKLGDVGELLVGIISPEKPLLPSFRYRHVHRVELPLHDGEILEGIIEIANVDVTSLVFDGFESAYGLHKRIGDTMIVSPCKRGEVHKVGKGVHNSRVRLKERSRELLTA